MTQRAPSLAHLQRDIIARCDESLWHFTRMAFPLVETARPFLDGRHIHCVAEHLEAVSTGQITNLLVNMPPGYMKSLLTCVMWPTWHWIKHGVDTTWMFASFDPQLTRRDARKARELITSAWFRERWGSILADESEPEAWYWTKNEQGQRAGWRFATSVQSKATGHHSDMAVVDDPLKPLDALGGTSHSKAAIENCKAWYDGTWSNRTFDRKKRHEVLTMQRLHTEDLAGYLEKKGGYEVLRMPLEFERKHAFVTSIGTDWRTTDGELLWPEKDGPAEVEATKKGLGSPHSIAAQLQQRPVPAGGLVFELANFRYWHTDPEGRTDQQGRPLLALPLRGGVQLSSWDLAFKGSLGSDRVAYGVWWKHGAFLYALAGGANVQSFTACKLKFKAIAAQHRLATRKLVEDKANGPALEDSLKKTISGITLVNPQGGKMSRALATQPVVDSGHVVLPWPEMPGCQWVTDFLDEVCNFPFHRYDDQTDQFTQAVVYLESKTSKLRAAMQAAREEGLV